MESGALHTPTAPALRLVHYWWPLAMGASFTVVVQRATDRPVDVVGLALFLCCVTAAYSLDRVYDRPAGIDPPWLRLVLSVTGLVAGGAGVLLLSRMPFETAVLVPLLGVIVLSYPRLKALPLVKIVLVAVAWTWCAIALPFHDGSWFGWRSWLVPVSAPLALIVAGGTLLCDLKDTEADRSSSVGSLPVRLGVARSALIAAVMTTTGAALALFQHRFGLAIGGLGLSLAAMFPERLARDVAGPLVVDVILTVPGVLVLFRLV